jgi:hypothetical protein
VYQADAQGAKLFLISLNGRSLSFFPQFRIFLWHNDSKLPLLWTSYQKSDSYRFLTVTNIAEDANSAVGYDRKKAEKFVTKPVLIVRCSHPKKK